MYMYWHLAAKYMPGCSLAYRFFFHVHNLFFAHTGSSLITNCQTLFKGFVLVLHGSLRNIDDSETLLTREGT